MAVHVVRVYHDHFVKRESNPRAGATTSRTAASLRPRCNSAILAQTHTNISKRTIGASPVSKIFHLVIILVLFSQEILQNLRIVSISINGLFFK